VFEQLRCEKGADAVLLTGRIRVFEREELVAAYLPRMKAGRADDVNPRLLYVVATQTVEVGADLDFDALVTEAASLDALRQRFGRLNRFGKRDHCRAVIVYVSFGRNSAPDPIYGEALAATWKWMEKTAPKPKGKKSSQRRKVLDFGVQAIQAAMPNGEILAGLLTPSKLAPVLMPSHMDMLVQTSPVPMVEPEIALQLHGVETGLEDVQIVWRTDLSATLRPEDEEAAIETVVILPPIQLETVAVPIWVVRAWLRGAPSADFADVEGSNQADERIRNNHFRLAVRWRGDRESRLVDPGDIRPGDTIVVPATYGGHDSFGWNPDHNQAVLDIADSTALQQRGKYVLRMHPSLLPQWFEANELSSEALHALEDVISRHIRGESLPELCDELIEQLLDLPSLKQGVRDALVGLQKNRRELLYPSSKRPEGILLQERKNVAREFTDEDDSSSLTREVLLEGHCKGVGDLAETFSSHLGIGKTLVNDVGLSGKLHDLGKADPRFQIWLQGGDRILTRRCGKLLAKSGKMGVTDWHARRVARERAGYPKGARHECYSVAIAMSNNLVLDGANDKDLVLYLIGVHHGFGRPLMPSVKDEGVMPLSFEFDGRKLGFSGQHGLERLGSGWADRFWLLVRRYGYWGLAYLETLVRLADHRRSELGQ